MKMILAVVNKQDAKTVVHELVRGGFQVTRLASSGGFLHTGTVTLLCGMKDERVEKALEIIGDNSRKRSFALSKIPNETKSILNYDTKSANVGDIVVGGASCFVLNVEEYVKY